MPTDSIQFDTLKGAVKSVLESVGGVGKIETRQGGSETWIDRAAPKQAFWEISIQGEIPETGAGIGTQAFERPTVVIEGFMPFSYADRTEDFWDALVQRMRTRIRTYFPSLNNAGADGLRGTGLPQTTAFPVQRYSDEKSDKKVHHVIIRVTVERHFVYTVSTTPPA
jgi:hypothetical protein